MKTGLQFLLASRRSEIAELERLARSCAMVDAVGALAHAVQRERGITNLFLGSDGARFDAMRTEQYVQTDALRKPVLDGLDALDTEPGHLANGARLFNRIAAVLQGLEGLGALRESVRSMRATPRSATEAYTQLLADLHAVVFETAHSAGDPAVARELVALFHYMQGKELAGRERAHGAAVFAAGHIDKPSTAKWRRLVDQQQLAFDMFREFADPALVETDRVARSPALETQVERLRRIGWTLGDLAMDESLPALWYRTMTERIDAMRATEEQLATHLRSLCEAKIGEARARLEGEAEEMARSAAVAPAFGTPAAPGLQLERSVMDLVHEQSRYLQAMGEELETVRAALNERKLVEQARELLMASRQLREDETYTLMRQMAMDQKRRIGEVAEALLAMREALPGSPPPGERRGGTV